MPLSTHVTVETDELPALQAAMRDAQAAASEFYGQTARNDSMDDLGTPVRRFLVAAQTVNELLTNTVRDAATYKAITSSDGHTKAGLVRGVKYVRNVVQHVAHVIRPGDDRIYIGGNLGMRVYPFWDEVPNTVHLQLYPGTQKRKADYDAHLLGKNVTETMLDLLKFFSDVAPGIPHRDQRGEWTGFPLMNHPGVDDRLHPEEPFGEVTARTWLDERRPNGNVRVICGQLTIDRTRYVLGHTFIGRLSFTPFVETTEQLSRDVSVGFPYVVGDVLAHTEDRSGDYPYVVQGAVFESYGDIETWTRPASSDGWDNDWFHGWMSSTWRGLVDMERGEGASGSTAYLVRRARRLNALAPSLP